MIDQEHTIEPWETRERDYIYPKNSDQHIARVKIWFDSNEAEESENTHEAWANAKRIVACVNACAGIKDPVNLRKQHDDMLIACLNLAKIINHNKELALGYCNEDWIKSIDILKEAIRNIESELL